jgi:hypothetical protein
LKPFDAQSEKFTGTHARGVGQMEQTLVLTLADILRDADAIGTPSVAPLQRTFTP